MDTSRIRPLRKLAVVGAGNMGSGIAQKMASEGFPVVLVDLDDEKVGRGLAAIERTLAEGVERRIFKPEQAHAIRGRIHGTVDWKGLGDVDLVVEAVFEDRSIKKDVFARLDQFCRPDAILATNTSSFFVTELAAATRRPERVLGLHYFYHPAKNRLVEVVPGRKTGSSVLARSWTLQEQIGKTPIASADSAGFVVNRFFVPWLNEAVRALEEGVADLATIEEAARQAFGSGMGPFELMNITGVPITLHAATTLEGAFGAVYRPSELLRRQVESGMIWNLPGAPDPSRFQVVADRLLAITFYVASTLVDQNIGTVEDTDIGARVGLRWPRGPFEMINRIGVEKAAGLVEPLAKRWDLKVPELLTTQARSRRPFSFAWVRSDTREGVATLTVNRPDTMNALNEAVVFQLHSAFRRAAADPDVRGIVIAGAGKAFVAGADIRFFVRNMESGDLDRILDFTRAGHALLDDIAHCPKAVVARLHGLALGGGVELALACHHIVATPRATIAFPETGIGIYPGLGGTQRATRRIGVGLAKWLIFTGQTLSADEALAVGVVDRVVPHEELDQAVREAIAAGPVTDRKPAALPERYRALDAFFAGNEADRLREGKADAGGNGELAKAMKRVASKAPIALSLAELLIERGSGVPLEQGLLMELDHLKEIFGTRDALEGMSTLGKRPPAFEGG